ncbi:DUF2946 family protein [Variovorax sp. VNK109]|uniref:DUF2946 family protein n=1 Tax=Variovorax sp. VNK109 TaxID=3400919 RepID=UPI003BFFF613
MHRLRMSLGLARLVLAWFALTVAAAIASPVVHPQQMQLVCSDGGKVKLVVVGDDNGGKVKMGHHALDCPACLAVTLPTHYAPPSFQASAPQTGVLAPFVEARLALLVGAPLPARGPPKFL